MIETIIIALMEWRLMPPSNLTRLELSKRLYQFETFRNQVWLHDESSLLWSAIRIFALYYLEREIHNLTILLGAGALFVGVEDVQSGG